MSDSRPPDTSDEEIEALRRVAKEELRKRLAAVRRTLSAETRRARAEAMCRQLSAFDAYASAKVIAGYAALRFEPDPASLLERAHHEGKVVGLPRVVAGTSDLTLHEVTPDTPLEESGFAVREPPVDAPQLDLRRVDLVLVPGLAFDARGYRLGFGKGFYDRFLPRLPNATRVGLAFELSLLVEVPNAAHDAPVDWIVTDRRVIRCER